MALRPKRFGPVFVRYDGAGQVSFATQEDGEGQPHPPSDKPVLTLMASVGHCLVESMRIVAGRDKTELPAFAISVAAEKSLDPPGRLHKMDCRVHGLILDDPAAVKPLVDSAKSICTISNTLNSTITMELDPPA